MKRTQIITAKDAQEEVVVTIKLNLKNTDAYNKTKAASTRIAFFTDEIFSVLGNSFHMREIDIL